MHCLATLVLALGVALPDLRPLPSDFMLGGIQINEADHDRWAQTLVASGFNTVEVTVYARQADWDGSNLWWAEEEPAVVSEIRAAKRAGLQVFLILRLGVDHAYPRNAHLWHGQVYPRSQADFQEWFSRYRRFALRWAQMAQREGVNVLALGSELNALTTTALDDPVRRLARWMVDPDEQSDFRTRLLKHESEIRPRHLRGHGIPDGWTLARWLESKGKAEQAWAQTLLHWQEPFPCVGADARKLSTEAEWRSLARAVRKAFSGPVGYAANFDQYFGLGFWDELDFVGINAYFPVRAPGQALSRFGLVAAWKKVLEDVSARLRALGVSEHPIVFTELGYTRHANTTLAPWAMNGLHLLLDGTTDYLHLPQDQPVDFQERTWAVEALAEARTQTPARLAGVLYWKLTTEPAHRPHEPFALILGEGDPLEKALRALKDGPSRAGAPAP